MTEKQILIADALLKYLAEHNNCTNTFLVDDYLINTFGYEAGIDIEYVKQRMCDDYHLIAPLGEAFTSLTHEGSRMAKLGMKNYQRKLSYKEQFQVAGTLIGIVSSAIGIVGFILGLLL